MATSTLRAAFKAWAARHNYKVVNKLEAQGDTRIMQHTNKGKASGEWTVEVAWPGGTGRVCEGVGRHYPFLSYKPERAIAWFDSH